MSDEEDFGEEHNDDEEIEEEEEEEHESNSDGDDSEEDSDDEDDDEDDDDEKEGSADGQGERGSNTPADDEAGGGSAMQGLGKFKLKPGESLAGLSEALRSLGAGVGGYDGDSDGEDRGNRDSASTPATLSIHEMGEPLTDMEPHFW